MSISKSQINASLALSDRAAYGVCTVEDDTLKGDGSIKQVLIHWVLSPVFDASNKLAFFSLSYVSVKGKTKGELIESARLQPSKSHGFAITFQDRRESTIDAISQFTSLDKSMEFVQTNVLPPSYFQLAFVYANCKQAEVTDLDSGRTLNAASVETWKAALETGSRLLPQYFTKTLAPATPATVETPATPATTETTEATEASNTPATVETPAKSKLKVNAKAA